MNVNSVQANATLWANTQAPNKIKKIFVNPREFKNEDNVTISYFQPLLKSKMPLMTVTFESGEVRFFQIKNWSFIEKNFSEKVIKWVNNGVSQYIKAFYAGNASYITVARS